MSIPCQPRLCNAAPCSKRHGFTLIELSIVLVIIGLIVGGVLTGRDLIRAARLQKVISEVTKLRTAVYTFKVKYNAMPGDMMDATNYFPTCVTDPNNSGNLCNGNGDGVMSGYESFRFSQHLSLARMIEGSYTGYPGTTGVTYYQQYVNTIGSTIRATALYEIMDCSPSTGFGLCANLSGNLFGVFTGRDAKYVDQKIDDGLPGYNENSPSFPYRGNVVSFTADNSVGGTYSFNAYSTLCSNPFATPPDYNITSTEVNCSLTFNLQ